MGIYDLAPLPDTQLNVALKPTDTEIAIFRRCNCR